MELILLLQELQQEKTQKQLLSPLPFPTTLPLLSACIAQQKTVIADPVRHLHNLTHDMLITITGKDTKQPKISKKYHKVAKLARKCQKYQIRHPKLAKIVIFEFVSFTECLYCTAENCYCRPRQTFAQFDT